MDKSLIGAGTNAATQVLDSGHIVISIGTILVIILLLCMIAMYRYFTKQIHRLQEENQRLTNIVIETQSEMMTTVKNWTDRIDALIRASLTNGNH